MPNQKISELTAVTSPSVNDVLPIVNAGATKKITIPNLVTGVLSGTSVSLSAVELPGNLFIRSVSANNIFIGDNNTTGNNNLQNSNNFVFGINSARSLSASQTNIIVGLSSVRSPVFLKDNIFLGNRSGGNMNFKFGSNFTSVPRPDTIEDNIVMGSFAGFNLSQSSCCNRYQSFDYCGIPYYIYSNECGSSNNNIFLGKNAGYKSCFACYNIFLGASAARLKTTGNNNIFLGNKAGINSSASNNILLGLSAGANVFFDNKISIGTLAGRSGGGISIGYKSGIGSINIGTCAGYCDRSPNNINIGNSSNLCGCNLSYNNIFLGNGAGGSGRCRGSLNVVIGTNAGISLTNTNNTCYNVLIGSCTGSPPYGSSGSGFVLQENIIIGSNAGNNLQCQNIVMGRSTGRSRSIIGGLIALGNRNVFCALSSTGASSTISIGNCAGYMHGQGNNNIFLGHGSGCNYGAFDTDRAIEGCLNIFIGNNSGRERCSNRLNGNIMIGHCNYASSGFPLSATISLGACTRPTQSNQLAIGSNVFPLGTSTTAGASAGFLNVLLNGTVRKIMFFAN